LQSSTRRSRASLKKIHQKKNEPDEETPFNFVRILRNGIQLGFNETEIAVMYPVKIMRMAQDIRAEREEIEERKRFEEEQAEIRKLAGLKE